MFREDAPLVQLGLGEAGEVLRDQAAWRAKADAVTAYVEDETLHVSVADGESVRLPLTLPVARGESAVLPVYAGEQAGWLGVSPMSELSVRLPGSVGYAR
jgi:hypothetical protein